MATAQILPKELRLAAPPTMPRARSYLYKQQSTQSLYNAGETIQINLPRLQRSYLTKDSYIKFALKVGAVGDGTNTTSVCLDAPGAYGLIDKIEVYDYLGSTLLESTSGHGQLMSLLMDLNSGINGVSTHHNFSAGTFVQRASGGLTTATATLGTSTTPSAPASGVGGTTDGDTIRFLTTSGAPIVTSNASATVPVTYQREFAIPIFSFLGLLSTKYAPLHNGYTINITLNPVATAFGITSNLSTDNTLAAQQAKNLEGRVTAQLYDVYYCCQILELGAEAEALLASSTGGQPLIVPTKAFRNYQGAFGASVGSYRLDLNLNVASLTNILWMMRPSTSLVNGASRTLSDRIRNYLQSWYFQYGSSILPQTSGIQCRSKSTTSTNASYYGPGGAYDASEAYIELLKSRHAFNQPTHTQKLSLKEFVQDAVDIAGFLSANNPAQTARFAAGLDLELVSGRSNDMVCGMNTNGMNTSIYATFDNTAGTVAASRVDAWCEYDAFINVMPGIATTVSF